MKHREDQIRTDDAADHSSNIKPVIVDSFQKGPLLPHPQMKLCMDVPLLSEETGMRGIPGKPEWRLPPSAQRLASA